jgi:ABC-type dipeptide/oligopeptide/nickel transport system permease component
VLFFYCFMRYREIRYRLIAGQRSDISTRQSITRELGLDKPLHVQFFYYVNDLSLISVYEPSEQNQQKYGYQGISAIGGKVLVLKWPYLRRSFQTNKKVTEIILDNIYDTFWLALAAMVFASIVGILLGVIAALRQNKFSITFLFLFLYLVYPYLHFVSAILMAMIFGFYLSDFTGLNLTGQLWVNHPIRGRELAIA